MRIRRFGLGSELNFWRLLRCLERCLVKLNDRQRLSEIGHMTNFGLFNGVLFFQILEIAPHSSLRMMQYNSMALVSFASVTPDLEATITFRQTLWFQVSPAFALRFYLPVEFPIPGTGKLLAVFRFESMNKHKDCASI